MTIRSMAWQALTLALIAAIYVATKISENELRDPRFLDGWLLTAAFCFQLLLHIGTNSNRKSVEYRNIWLRLHTHCGFLTIAVFLFHAEIRVPDNILEWIIWFIFFLVIFSGVARSYFRSSEPVDLATEADHRTVSVSDQQLFALGEATERLANSLIASAESRFISDVFINTFYPFLSQRQNWLSVFRYSGRTSKKLIFQVDDLKNELTDDQLKELDQLKVLIKEKIDIDRQHAINKLSGLIYTIHITAAYSLFLVVILHIVIVSAFSSGIH